MGSAIIPMLMFISPRQFGPPTGMPVRWAQPASSAWRCAPSAPPISEKPLDTISTAPTPFSSHCSRIVGM